MGQTLKLHVISFDVPYPPNYGGIIVVYYHLKALKELGITITLHCFNYNNNPKTDALNELCEKVIFYKRKKSLMKHLSKKPFIVNTRMPKELLNNLCLDDAPVFFEGIHTSGFLSHPKLQDRVKILRMHNIEWQYYQSLKDTDVDNWRRLFFHRESKKLRRFEKQILSKANLVLCLTKSDTDYYKDLNNNTHHISAFHPNAQIHSKTGSGEYALFHGKLSVPDNEAAVFFLIEEVFSKYKYPFKVAGLNPSQKLRERIELEKNIELIEAPDANRMNELVRNAHANILWSFQNNGVKLKLLHSLYKGRYCIVNENMLFNNEKVDKLCLCCDKAEEVIQNLISIKKQDFTAVDVRNREEVLKTEFDNLRNAKKTIDLIKKTTFN